MNKGYWREKSRNKYRSAVTRKNGERIYSGYFETEAQALEWHNQAIRLFGLKKKQNKKRT
jgi:hypothetical protein